MKTRIFAGLLAFCLLFAFAGCSGSSDTDTSGVDSEGQSESVPTLSVIGQQELEETPDESEDVPEIDPEMMNLIKYNTYVEMNNYMVEVLHDIDSYYAVVEYGAEFVFVPDSGLEYKHNISLYDSSIVDEAVAMAVMEPAYEGLDELTLEIATSMKALMDTFSDIYSCYDFADNQYAKAKEFHAIIQTHADTFKELADLYMGGVEVVGNERVAENERKMLNDGMLITYNASHAMTVTRRLLEECYAQDVYDDNIIELDLTAVRLLYDELVATVTAYEEAVSDPNQLMKESLAGSPVRSMNSLLQAVEWMIKQVESQTPHLRPGPGVPRWDHPH